MSVICAASHADTARDSDRDVVLLIVIASRVSLNIGVIDGLDGVLDRILSTFRTHCASPPPFAQFPHTFAAQCPFPRHQSKQRTNALGELRYIHTPPMAVIGKLSCSSSSVAECPWTSTSSTFLMASS